MYDFTDKNELPSWVYDLIDDDDLSEIPITEINDYLNHMEEEADRQEWLNTVN